MMAGHRKPRPRNEKHFNDGKAASDFPSASVPKLALRPFESFSSLVWAEVCTDQLSIGR
jgi:hypothetical protein